VIRRLALLLLVVVPACGGSDPPRQGPAVCEVSFDAPAGFERLDTFEERYPDRVGVRLDFRDDARREFHVLVGIPGEFGEGMSSAGELELAEGRTATLYAGPEGVWLLFWEQGDRCDPRAVIVNGFTRAELLDALAEVGLVEAGVGG
jgi:hypothetical protein